MDENTSNITYSNFKGIFSDSNSKMIDKSYSVDSTNVSYEYGLAIPKKIVLGEEKIIELEIVTLNN